MTDTQPDQRDAANEEWREKHKKLLDKLTTEKAKLIPLGRFKHVAIYGVRGTQWTDEQWTEWLKAFGAKLAQPDPNGSQEK
jgi:hypothetical protein